MTSLHSPRIHRPRALPSLSRRRMRGFTLIESVMVIVITGILAAMVAVFIRFPVEGYVASVRRAELTDQAEVALRRMQRDIRLAVPNSLRVATVGGVNYIEFIITSGGGRYRDPSDGSTAGNFLRFNNAAVLNFDVVGAMPDPPIVAGADGVGDFIVVYNLGPGSAPGDAYATGNACANCNRARVANIAGNTITLANNPFGSQSPPLTSPNARFQVVPAGQRAVTYACPEPAPAGAPGNLLRYANYGFFTAQQTTDAALGGAPAIVATAAVTCAVNFAPNVMGRSGLLHVQLNLTSDGEIVTLSQQIHVDNAP